MVEAAQRAGREPELAKYEIREEIGRGGMATVYRAVDRRLGREVAVKVIHPHLRDSAEVASRFHTEAKAVAKLRHPNIVEVFDVSGPEEREQYLVAELVRGTTLRRLLQRHGALPPEVAALVALQLLDALAQAHASGVIHRDIKPENVLVECDPSAETPSHTETRPGDLRDDSRPRRDRAVRIKLTDFGIAKLLDAQGVTSTGQVLGSPAHMAPEQIEGGDVDARSDVFGLGVLFYECLVGHLPFEGSNPAQVLRRVLEGLYSPAQADRPAVGARWSAIVDRALARERDGRFATATAMRDAIAGELERLGFWPGDGELGEWIDDAQAYEARHAKRVVERLRTLAAESRRRGDAIAAAGDYNRALALVPDDPVLLRIAARMHRAELWTRALRRGAIAGGVLLVAGVGSAVVARRVVHRAAAPRPPEALAMLSSPSSAAPQVPAAEGEPARTTTAVGGAVVPALGPGAHDARSLAAEPAPGAARVAARPVERSVVLDVTPPMGVSVAVDGQGARAVATGDALKLDASAHSLSFTCPVCSAVRVYVAAGERGDTLVVSVPIKPATLVIEGSLGSTYQLLEHPELTVSAGGNSIPLKSAFERATVKQMQTGLTSPVRLEAGQTVRVSFAP